MSGIYIHIPYCTQACHYCNFHFSTTLHSIDRMIEAMCVELAQRKQYLPVNDIDSIYFGGGSPSVLNPNQLNTVFDSIHKHYNVKPTAEITLEINPEDVNAELLDAYKAIGVNRLSVGVQSFDDDILKWMNRSHTAAQAKHIIELAASKGFEKITLDLIYGIPQLTDNNWINSIKLATDLPVQHISAYCLTVEKNTALHHFIQNKKSAPLDEEQAARHFDILISELMKVGFEQYEISNFAKPGCYAIHNSNYWLSKSYLGIGPSAHSFNGNERRWNISNNNRYIQQLFAGENYFETEQLTLNDRYNEYVMTGLRTKWGVEIQTLQEKYGSQYLQNLNTFNKLLNEGLLEESEGRFKLTAKAKFLADGISASLFC